MLFDQEVLPRSEQWVGLVVVSLLTTPLQAAGEEIAFRGGLVQSVGSWFRSPVVALVVTTILSTVTFVAAHGSFDPWIVIEIGTLAVFGCYLAWRTGGLEAVLVIHIVNNVLITVTGALFGGLEESYVDTTSTGSPAVGALGRARHRPGDGGAAVAGPPSGHRPERLAHSRTRVRSAAWSRRILAVPSTALSSPERTARSISSRSAATDGVSRTSSCRCASTIAHIQSCC